MSQSHHPAAQVSAATDPNAAARTEIMDAIRHRNEEILAIGAPYSGNPTVQAIINRSLVDPAVTVERFGADVLAAPGPRRGAAERWRRRRRGICTVVCPRSAAVTAVAATSSKLPAIPSVLRAGIGLAKPHPGVRDVQGWPSATSCGPASAAPGGRRGFGANTRSELVKAGDVHSAISPPSWRTLGKALRAGYEAEPATFEARTRRVLVPDFKLQSRVLLGSASHCCRSPKVASTSTAAWTKTSRSPTASASSVAWCS